MKFYETKKAKEWALLKTIFGVLIILLSAFLIDFCLSSSGIAGNPKRAYYSEDSSDLYWFLIISDTHIGKSSDRDSKNLNQVVRGFYETIKPKFIINTGDLTDQLIGKPLFANKLKQWQEYWYIVDNAGMDNIVNGVPVYTDAPGNHDQYYETETTALNNYKEYSIQGRATNDTQRSWLYPKLFGKDHFITIATPDPLMTSPRTDFLSKCPGDLDDEELNFIQISLENESDANLTFVFGHHPLSGDWGAINGGRDTFINLLCDHKASIYAFGHTHREKFIEPYFESCQNSEDKFLAFNVTSLYADNEYAIIAVDNNGIAVTYGILHQRNPVVLITAPLDKNLGGTNPYAYNVPSRTKNPIRALIFNANPKWNPYLIVQYRVNSGEWHPMSQSLSNPYLWETLDWDTTSLDPGVKHTLEVQACFTLYCFIPGSHMITFEIEQKYPWPMFGHDAQHTGQSPYVGPKTPNLRWTFEFKEGASSGGGGSPVVDEEGTVYIPEINGDVGAKRNKKRHKT